MHVKVHINHGFGSSHFVYSCASCGVATSTTTTFAASSSSSFHLGASSN
ncbi:hypothetical protein Lalb_Chr21g0316691 [Lupinus albus]|uniref:Uncharacterized protein n=1 Tax=Lupinus albus TaxID=3870 RepID=A0A6A4NU74_LUPAL|nr:hypothetical protein Lalb_Chr21g0316691 [Lupinus albus]